MSLVAAGLLNKQIAGKLGLSEVTVKIHRRMKKMRAGSFSSVGENGRVPLEWLRKPSVT